MGLAERRASKKFQDEQFPRWQADVSAAYSIKDQDARGWFVYNTLSEHAARTQAYLKTFLGERGITYQSF